MNEEILNKIYNKVLLLYKINDISPIFLLIAQRELESGNIDEAETIIEKGLSNFPEHPTALIIKAKILVKKGNYSQSINLIKKASKIIGSPKTFDYYLNELDTIIKPSFTLEIPKQSDIIKEISQEQKAESPQTFTITNDIKTESTRNTFSQNYDSIDDSIIISDTLAKIYFNQKEYKEAIRIYTKLKTKYPDKSDFYESKITEIRAILENSQNA